MNTQAAAPTCPARKTISNGGLSGSIPSSVTQLFWSGWQTVQENNDQVQNNAAEYVWGIYIDELVQMQVYTNDTLLSTTLGGTLYPLQDLLYRTTALSDSSAVVREAYDTDAYGNTLIFRNAGSPPAPITWMNTDAQVPDPTCAFIFTGQRFDPEAIWYSGWHQVPTDWNP